MLVAFVYAQFPVLFAVVANDIHGCHRGLIETKAIIEILLGGLIAPLHASQLPD